LNRTGRYKFSNLLEFPSSSEFNTLKSLSIESKGHDSGGSYDMIALWVKGSNYIRGFNRLNRAASTIDISYPDVCGVHAELDLWRKSDGIKGGTIYIAGKRNSSGTFMTNTRPCIYCSALLMESGVRYAVFYSDGLPSKIKVSNLLDGINYGSNND
jgi:tRNA(Arg) A34 adenosine deaminase TadA